MFHTNFLLFHRKHIIIPFIYTLEGRKEFDKVDDKSLDYNEGQIPPYYLITVTNKIQVRLTKLQHSKFFDSSVINIWSIAKCFAQFRRLTSREIFNSLRFHAFFVLSNRVNFVNLRYIFNVISFI